MIYIFFCFPFGYELCSSTFIGAYAYILFQDLFDHSARAALISASDFPAYDALCIIVFVKSSGERSSSPGYTSTPSFPAKSLTYLRFLILPIFDNESCILANALKFGISAAS